LYSYAGPPAPLARLERAGVVSLIDEILTIEEAIASHLKLVNRSVAR
jgi:hypothetical protein